MPTPCPICDDSGLRVIERPDGSRAAQECSCRIEKRVERSLGAAHIPKRYQHCTIDDFIPDYAGRNKSLQNALVQSRSFISAYPLQTSGKGLIFTGRNGTGKTHLAVGVLKALVLKGAKALFVTFDDLLKQVRDSYNPTVQQTELGVLRPVTDAEVLVIDELGSSKPSDWVWDTVSHILNTRYNDMRTTIITTNYRNERGLIESDIPNVPTDARNAWIALYRESLGDRIGERMRSRLLEMCRVVEMDGDDFRDKIKRPSFD